MQFGCATREIVSIEVAGTHIENFSQIGKGLLRVAGKFVFMPCSG